MPTKNFICVVCPVGCELTVETTDKNEILRVSGNNCKRGDAYARTELTNPTRTFTSTVRVKDGKTPLVSVKSAKAIPKNQMFAAANVARRYTAQAPIRLGDVFIPDLAGTGIALVATADVAADRS
jgi:CxxC motif-containing protein